MRTLVPGLQDHLDAGATTLCDCWRVTRSDGVRSGFTDHDEALEFDGTRFEAASGFDGSEAVSALGLKVGNAEVAGAFASARITEAELHGGAYDGAIVERWTVNWSDPEQRVRLAVSTIGEVRSEDGAFTAELRGPAQALQRKTGRSFIHVCAARIGDAACGVDLDDRRFFADGLVVSSDGERRLIASGCEGFADHWFTRGTLRWTGGANAGRAVEVKAHEATATGVSIALWHPAANPVADGDAFRITAGCDKRFETCAAKFANALNFRGFPHMPGNDFAVTYPTRGETHDGAPLR